MKAWRCFLGWRKSWLSREILVFGAWLPLLYLAVVTGIPAIGVAAVLTGLLGVFCSVMVYVDTRREFWTWPRTGGRFFGTVILCAAVAGSWGVWLALALKLAAEASGFAVTGSRSLMLNDLKVFTLGRYVALGIGLAIVPLSLVGGLVVLIVGELLERILYFRAIVEPRMP